MLKRRKGLWLLGSVVLLILIFNVASYFYFKHPFIPINANATLNKELEAVTLPKIKSDRPVRILVLEGGGVRGIISLHLLKALESKANKPIAELFDIVAATSTGSIISSLLLTPNGSGKPKYSAETVLNDYPIDAKQIFHSNIIRKLLTLNGLLGPQYSHKNLIDDLQAKLGTVQFHQLLRPLLIPTYSINQHQPQLFKNWENGAKGLPTWALISSAASAPGFFPPSYIKNLISNKTHLIIDGAVYANNPSMIALSEALNLFPNNKYIIVSVGTGLHAPRTEREQEMEKIGRIKWIVPIVPLMISAQTEQQATLLEIMSQKSKHPEISFYNFNLHIADKHAPLDDISDENLQALHSYGKKLVKDNDQKLNQLVKKLKKEDAQAAVAKRE